MLKLHRSKITKYSEKTISEDKIFIGLDIHLKSWNISVLGKDIDLMKGRTVPPDPKVLAETLKRKYNFQRAILAYEAGFSGFVAQRELEALGIETIVVNPADIPTTSKNSTFKSDPRDSVNIAMNLRAGMLTGIYVPTIAEEANQALLRERFTLVKKQTRVKHQIKGLIKKHGIKLPGIASGSQRWSNKYINAILEYARNNSLLGFQLNLKVEELLYHKENINKTEKKLKELVNSDRYREDYNNLMTVPGVGEITSMTLLLELYNVNRFSRFDKFACFMGLVPTEYSSGEKQRHGHLSRRCKGYLKSLLIEAAWAAVNSDEELNRYYKQLTSRMDSRKAIIRCTRKLLSRIFFILKNKETYKINKAA